MDCMETTETDDDVTRCRGGFGGGPGGGDGPVMVSLRPQIGAGQKRMGLSQPAHPLSALLIDAHTSDRPGWGGREGREEGGRRGRFISHGVGRWFSTEFWPHLSFATQQTARHDSLQSAPAALACRPAARPSQHGVRRSHGWCSRDGDELEGAQRRRSRRSARCLPRCCRCTGEAGIVSLKSCCWGSLAADCV